MTKSTPPAPPPAPPATYRIQIVKLPQATGGRWWNPWIGSESTAILIKSSVELLEVWVLQAQEREREGLHEQGRRMAAAVSEAHGVEDHR